MTHFESFDFRNDIFIYLKKILVGSCLPDISGKEN